MGSSAARPAPVSLPGSGCIPLCTRAGAVRAYTYVDLADVARVSQFSWHLNSRGYATRQVPKNGGGQWSQSLHRFILDLGRGDAPGMQVDHIDHDQLNNRRSNLRLVSVSTNQLNRISARVDSTTGIRGVSPDRGRWRVRVQIDGERRVLGYFGSREEAEAARLAFDEEAAA